MELDDQNTFILHKIITQFKEGDIFWSGGCSYKEKEKGFRVILEGVRMIRNILLSNGNQKDQKFEIALQNLYQMRSEDLKCKFETLGKYEKDEYIAIREDLILLQMKDIIGLEKAKEGLKEAVLLPLKFPILFSGSRKPWRGILLFGPLGSGKTTLVKACAIEAGCTLFSVSFADLISEQIEEGDKLLKTIFYQARIEQPSIIYIDEIDSICDANNEKSSIAKRRVITEFLIQMQSIGQDDVQLIVICASKFPWALDYSIRKRLEKRIYIPLPDITTRTIIIQKFIEAKKIKLQRDEIEEICLKTEGYSYLDINDLFCQIIQEKMRIAICQKQQQIDNKNLQSIANFENYRSLPSSDVEELNVNYIDFLIALGSFKKTVNQDQLLKLEKWNIDFGCDV